MIFKEGAYLNDWDLPHSKPSPTTRLSRRFESCSNPFLEPTSTKQWGLFLVQERIYGYPVWTQVRHESGFKKVTVIEYI